MTTKNNVNLKIPFTDLTSDIFWRKLLRFLSSLSSNRDKELTSSELSVLVRFLQLPKSYEHRMFSRVAKNKVRQLCKENGWVLSSMNLNNKLYSLESKGYLVKDEDGVMYLSKDIRDIWRKLREQEGEPLVINALLHLEHVPKKNEEVHSTIKRAD